MATHPLQVLDDEFGLDPAAVATLFAGAAVVASARVDLAPGVFLVAVFDLRSGLAEALALQMRARAVGAWLLFVGVEPGGVQFGPLVGPNAGCLACRTTRAQNNDPRPQAVTGQRPAPTALRPVGPAAMAMLRMLAGHYADRRTAAGLVDGYVAWRAADLSLTVHRFVPVADCDLCSPSDVRALVFGRGLKTSATDKRVANPALTVPALRAAFVDRHCGLIKHVFQDTASALMPLCSAEMQLGHGEQEAGYGRAASSHQSELVAILEALERHAGHVPAAPRGNVRASFADLTRAGERALDPVDLILHDPNQRDEPGFRLVPYSPDLEVNWTPALSLRGGDSVLIPEQFGFYRLGDRPGAPVNRFAYDSSSGCSLGGCAEEAILGGLYELVERDAYLATWYSRIPPRRIATASVGEPRSAAVIARAEAEGYEIILFDITTDIGIPSVWAMAVDPADDAIVKSYCASACHGRWAEAVFSALVEVTTSMGVYRRSMGRHRARAEALFADAAAVQAMEDHVLLYSLPQAYSRLAFLHGGPTVTLADCEAALPSLAERDLGSELRRQVDRVLRVTGDVVVIDQTTPAMAPFNLSCVKVIAPGLLPVTFGHQYRRIGLARINAVAAFRSPDSAPLTSATINPHPHNFP